MTSKLTLTELEALSNKHRFLRDDAHDNKHAHDWQVRTARRYYDKLYKEFAIVDLSQSVMGRVGMRWRTEMEVVAGKGDSKCAEKRCNEHTHLHSLEAPFSYQEEGINKVELVKVRLCDKCAAIMRSTATKCKKSSSRRDVDDSTTKKSSVDSNPSKDKQRRIDEAGNISDSGPSSPDSKRRKKHRDS